MPMTEYADGRTTAKARKRYGCWSCWNIGPPAQPRDEAIAHAAQKLRVRGDEGEPHPVPAELPELGLVYLRATVSPCTPDFSLEDDEARALRDPPPAELDRETQIAEMRSAMTRLVDVIYGSETPGG